MSEKIVAYILLTVETGKDREILGKIREFPLVKEASITFGEWDIIVRTEVEDVDELNSLVIKIRKIEGVDRTYTIITAK